MIRRILLLMLVLFMGCQSDNSIPVTNSYELVREAQETPNHGDLPQPFIVGGDEVDPACPDCKYPFMVSIQSGWGGHFCGGSLVREDWVITAAHCVDGDSPGNLLVKIGLHNVNGTTGSETRYVDQVITHPSYNGWSLDNDYALLHLTQPSSFEPIKLITNESHDDDGTWSTTMGWGATSSGGWGSDVLLEVGVPVDDDCGYIGNEITPNMICAGDENGGEDSCQGDSGGPLIVEWNGEYELIGIVSWGYGCADAGYPGVYSRVETRKDWFFSYIGEPEPEESDYVNLSFEYPGTDYLLINYESNVPFAGFQFNLTDTPDLVEIIDVGGGVAGDLGFNLTSSSEGVILGFSLEGYLIPAGSGTLTIVNFTPTYDVVDMCFENVIISSEDGSEVQSNVSECIEIQTLIFGDVNFDGTINVVDIVQVVSFILNTNIPTDLEFSVSDMNQDGILNILDVIQVVSLVLNASFSESVDWLKLNFPQLNVDRRLKKLDLIHTTLLFMEQGVDLNRGDKSAQ
jgi:trypsin